MELGSAPEEVLSSALVVVLVGLLEVAACRNVMRYRQVFISKSNAKIMHAAVLAGNVPWPSGRDHWMIA